MAEAICLTSRVRIPEDVAFRDLQGEAVLLNLRTGVYFGLDPMGTRIWHLIREHRSLQAVLDRLVGEYDVSEAGCRQDLLRFVAALRKHALVEVDPEPPA